MPDESDPADHDRLSVRGQAAGVSRTPWSRTAAWTDVGDVDSTVTLSASSVDLLGWAPADLAVVSAIELVHPDDREIVAEIAHGVGAADRSSPFTPLEMRILSRNRRYWWTRWHVWPAPDRWTVGASGVDYLRPDAEWGPPIGMWRWDVDADVMSWSMELLDMFRLGRGPTSYEAFLDVVLDEDRDNVAALIDGALVTGDPYVITFRCATESYGDRWFHATGRRRPAGADGTRRLAGMVKCLNPPLTQSGQAAVIGCG